MEMQRAQEALHAELGAFRPEIMIILGSGLGGLAGAVADPREIPFERIPGLPSPGVEGHAGRFLAGDDVTTIWQKAAR